MKTKLLSKYQIEKGVYGNFIKKIEQKNTLLFMNNRKKLSAKNKIMKIPVKHDRSIFKTNSH